MTKPKPNTSQAAVAFWANILYLQGIYSLTNNDIARIMKISVGTLNNRKNRPKSTTMGEIQRAADHFGIPPEQMITMFKPVAILAYDPEREEKEA